MRIALYGCCLCLTTGLAAQQPSESKLWPNGLPAGASSLDSERIAQLRDKNSLERITYVDEPTITMYRPTGANTGCAVVIFPGGGYHILAWQKEGVEIAQWFNSIGVSAAVVKYRVPRRSADRPHLEPLQDAQRAIRWTRYHADKNDIDPRRIGVLGFSAGGHLAVMTGTKWAQPSYEARDEIDRTSCRPDFMCPIYAAYLGTQYKDDVAELGPLVQVSPETPATFLSVSADDRMRGAQSALLFVELNKAGVPAELHVFGTGGHGYGIRGDTAASMWNVALEKWLEENGWLE